MLGRGGSSSRRIRSISSKAADCSRWRSNGVSPGQQLVQQHPQRIDIAAGVDVQLVQLRLLGTHVFQRADHLAHLREHRLFGQPAAWIALATPKSMIFGTGVIVVLGDQHVGWFDVAVNDSLLMRVLDGVADVDKQLQPLADGQLVFVTVLRDRNALDQFHRKERPTAVGGAGIQDVGDIGMVHHRQRLPLGLEPCDHLPRVHSRLDDLQRHPPLDRLGLLGHVDDAHAAFAELLQQLVGADPRAGFFGERAIATSPSAPESAIVGPISAPISAPGAGDSKKLWTFDCAASSRSTRCSQWLVIATGFV